MRRLPASVRTFTRRSIGMSKARPITPDALRELAVREDVLVIGVGMVRPGSRDPRLPGEQRTASLLSLVDSVAGVPKQRAIVLHCG